MSQRPCPATTATARPCSKITLEAHSVESRHWYPGCGATRAAPATSASACCFQVMIFSSWLRQAIHSSGRQLFTQLPIAGTVSPASDSDYEPVPAWSHFADLLHLLLLPLW